MELTTQFDQSLGLRRIIYGWVHGGHGGTASVGA